MSRSKKTKRPYDKTPTVPIAITPDRAMILKQIAANQRPQVYVADLVADAVEAKYGAQIDAILALVPCTICGIRGGCEHTFTAELPADSR